jgi:hypothetical protein
MSTIWISTFCYLTFCCLTFCRLTSWHLTFCRSTFCRSAKNVVPIRPSSRSQLMKAFDAVRSRIPDSFTLKLFQLCRCDFKSGDATSSLAMQLQVWRCDFKSGNATSSLAMRLQLRRCDFKSGDATSSLAVRFRVVVMGGVALRKDGVTGRVQIRRPKFASHRRCVNRFIVNDALVQWKWFYEWFDIDQLIAFETQEGNMYVHPFVLHVYR